MKTKTAKMYGTAGAVALLAAAVFAQTPTEPTPPPQKGVPLRPHAESTASAAPQDDAREIELDLRTRLVARDLDARMSAFDDAVERAATSAAAREALEEIAADTMEPDLAFTARLALREVDAADRHSAAPQGVRPRSPHAALDPFEAMREEIERAFGGDPFGADFFSSDPFLGRRRSGASPFGRPPLGLAPLHDDPFERIQKEVERIEAQLDAMRNGPGQPGNPAPGAQSFRSSSSMSVSMTPDGIRVEITEDDGSGPETKIYEAESKEALLEAHPELKNRLR